MKHADAVAYCLALPGAYLDHPWGPDHNVAKVGGKIFCFFGALEAPRPLLVITVKNAPELVELWRDRFPDHIGVARYLNKSHWNRVVAAGRGAPSPDEVRELIDDSYAAVVATLPKSARPA